MPDQRKPRAVTSGWTAFLSACVMISVAACTVAAQSGAPATDAGVAVGPQYGTTHVYIAAADFDSFVNSFAATFDGQSSKRAVSDVTPTPSSTQFQSVSTPVGVLSVFAYQTPIPFPFGEERTGYLVTDMDQAIREARAVGAAIIVTPFKDPIGMDAVIEWPGGVMMQLYWHFTPPKSAPLATIPDNRIYVSRDAADSFIAGFVRFSRGKIVSDDADADAGEIGRPGETYRRIRITSLFGNMQVMVTDGHLPYPFGRELMGYKVQDVAATLEKAKASGAKVLSPPYKASDRTTAIVEFPGGYIAEVHSVAAQ